MSPDYYCRGHASGTGIPAPSSVIPASSPITNIGDKFSGNPESLMIEKPRRRWFHVDPSPRPSPSRGEGDTNPFNE